MVAWCWTGTKPLTELMIMMMTGFFDELIRVEMLLILFYVDYKSCIKISMCAAHYSDVIMSMMASQITSFLIVCSTVCSGTDQRKHQSSASLAFVWGIHQSLVDSPHKGPVMWKMFPFDDVIMWWPGPHLALNICYYWVSYCLGLIQICSTIPTWWFSMIFISIHISCLPHMVTRYITF